MTGRLVETGNERDLSATVGGRTMQVDKGSGHVNVQNFVLILPATYKVVNPDFVSFHDQ